VSTGRYDEYVRRLREAITTTPGALDSRTRAAILGRDTSAIPATLKPYVLKVALHAYQVTDDDVKELKRQKLSEDEIFEATVAAAVGAALLRLEKGTAALKAAGSGA
jgi:hypothetical protein